MATGSTSDSTTPTGTPVTPGSHHIEIKDADAVQSGLANSFNWIEDNAKIFVALIVLAIIGGVAFASLQFVNRRQETQAQDAYYKAEAPFMKKKEEFERAKFKNFMPSEQAAAQPAAVAASGDIAKDYGTDIAELEKVAKDHAGTAAGAQAAILAAETYLSYKQPDKAVEIAQIPANKLSSSHTLAQLSRVVWGNALAAKGDCQAAVGVWQPLLAESKAAHLKGDLSLRSGVCFENIGQTERAMELYRQASTTAPESSAATTAKGLLRALELKGPVTASASAASASAPAAAAPAAQSQTTEATK